MLEILTPSSGHNNENLTLSLVISLEILMSIIPTLSKLQNRQKDMITVDKSNLNNKTEFSKFLKKTIVPKPID